MARSRLWDLYQNHKFHLLDITVSNSLTSFLARRDAVLGALSTGLRAPRQVLTPQYAFKSITAPSLTVEYEEIRSATNPYPRHVPTGAEVDPITLSRGVFVGDSDFYDWIQAAVHGRSFYRRRLLLIQLLTPPPTINAGPLGTLSPDVAWFQLVGSLVAAPSFNGEVSGTAKALSTTAAAAAAASALLGSSNGQQLASQASSLLASMTGRAWVLHDCVPSSYRSTDDFDGESAEIGVQELEIRMSHFEEFTIDSKPVTGAELANTAAGGLANALARGGLA